MIGNPPGQHRRRFECNMLNKHRQAIQTAIGVPSSLMRTTPETRIGRCQVTSFSALPPKPPQSQSNSQPEIASCSILRLRNDCDRDDVRTSDSLHNGRPKSC